MDWFLKEAIREGFSEEVRSELCDCQGRGSGRHSHPHSQGAFSPQPQAPMDLGSSPSGRWPSELLSAPHSLAGPPFGRARGPQCLTLGARRTGSLAAEIRPVPASPGRVGPKPLQEEEGRVCFPPPPPPRPPCTPPPPPQATSCRHPAPGPSALFFKVLL